MFNVPERIALAIASRRARVLYCEIPVSRFHRKGESLNEVSERVFRFGPEYLGAKLNSLPVVGGLQWKAVAITSNPGPSSTACCTVNWKLTRHGP